MLKKGMLLLELSFTVHAHQQAHSVCLYEHVMSRTKTDATAGTTVHRNQQHNTKDTQSILASILMTNTNKQGES